MALRLPYVSRILISNPNGVASIGGRKTAQPRWGCQWNSFTTDGQGGIISRHDYLPFGEEIFGVGSRSAILGYGPSNIRNGFTSYERDSESGLDFAKSRMFGSGLGRYTSPDPYNPFLDSNGDAAGVNDSEDRVGQFIAQPQYWNRYAYAINNPLKFVDRDGRHPVLAFLGAVLARAAIGAAVGAVVGGGIEAIRQLIFEEKMNWRSVGARAADGAIFGAFIGAAGPVGAVIGYPIRAAIVAGAIGSVTGGTVRREIEGQGTTTGDVLTDAAAGAAGGAVGGVVGRSAGKYKYLPEGAQRVVSNETAYRAVNGTANRLMVPRAITNSLSDSQMSLRMLTYGNNLPAGVARGTTRAPIRATRKCPKGPQQCTEVTVDVVPD